MFYSNNLKNYSTIFEQNKELYKDIAQKEESNHLSNINFVSVNEKKEIYWTSKPEMTFMLIYSFYKKLLKKEDNAESINVEFDPFAEMEFEKIPISMITFTSKKYSNTMRPTVFEYVNNFKFLIKMLYHIEKEKIEIKKFLTSLYLKDDVKPTVRTKILDKIVKLKPIAEDIETLMYKSFLQKFGKESDGFKHYKTIVNFIDIYEPLIKYGGNKFMDKELQKKAINLGKSIGQGILHSDESENKQANAKNGRGYIVSLKKVRTLSQFLEEVARLQTKYKISLSNELLENIDEQNFIYVKQFCIISALNQLNSVFIKKED